MGNCFVDFGGIVNHHCLNCLFIAQMSNYTDSNKWYYINSNISQAQNIPTNIPEMMLQYGNLYV